MLGHGALTVDGPNRRPAVGVAHSARRIGAVPFSLPLSQQGDFHPRPMAPAVRMEGSIRPSSPPDRVSEFQISERIGLSFPKISTAASAR